jgi:tetratricopeptide (TPR) repeat protein
VKSLELELLETGLATPNSYNHLTLNPALCAYLRGGMDPAELESLTTTWVATMCEFVEFLAQEQTRDTQLAATLTMMELPNLFALLELVQSRGDAEATLTLANSLFGLLRNANRPRLLERVCQVRDVAAASLEDKWNHVQFDAARSRIDEQVDAGRLHEALEGAQKLRERAITAGEQAYPDADYDMAMACWQLGGVLNSIGDAEEGLTLLHEARQRFEAIGESAEAMVSASISEIGSCLFSLGRLDEAVAAYEDGIRRDEKLGNVRGVAVGKGQIGSIRSDQGLYEEALEAHHEARERFMQLNELSQVAISWHQAGITYQDSGDPEAAEDAYHRALEIETQLGNVAGQAMTLNQLGTLCDLDGRLEEAVLFFQQAVEMSVRGNDLSKEGLYRNNLADVLRQLERYDEARREVRRAIECTAEFGDASHPWNMWANLAGIEMDAGNSSAGADANKQAIAGYLSYRRSGGENHYLEGEINCSVTESLLAGDDAAAASFLKEKAADPEIMETSGTFIHALQSIVAGSRDRTLADAPDLDYTMAAEILLLIETLEKKSSNHLDSA